MTQATPMNDDQWFDKYKPVPNPTGDSGFCIGDDSFLFETYGNDLEKILDQVAIDADTVWTYMDCDESDDMMIVPGYCRVNALGYFMTEIPCDTADQGNEIICV